MIDHTVDDDGLVAVGTAALGSGGADAGTAAGDQHAGTDGREAFWEDMAILSDGMRGKGWAAGLELGRRRQVAGAGDIGFAPAGDGHALEQAGRRRGRTL
jgi:hypothetical protein